MGAIGLWAFLPFLCLAWGLVMGIMEIIAGPYLLVCAACWICYGIYRLAVAIRDGLKKKRPHAAARL